MPFLFRCSFFVFIFYFITFFGHNTPKNLHQAHSINVLEEAMSLINEASPQNQIDEGTDKDRVFLNKKINALLEFDGIIKAIPTQTNLGLAVLANRIENPINKSAILEERQKAITYLAQNPELLHEIKALLLQITPEIEKILLENTVDSNQDEKKLYCQSSLLIPKSIATIINSSTFLLALWQVVPHVGGFLGTIFDPIMHLAGTGHCNHSHGHSHKDKKKTMVMSIKKQRMILVKHQTLC